MSKRWVTSFLTSFGRGSLLTSTPFLRVVNSKRVKLRFLVSVLNDTVLEMTVLVRLLSGTGLRSASGIGGGAVGGFSFTMVRCCLVQRLRRKDVANFLDKMTVNSEIVFGLTVVLATT